LRSRTVTPRPIGEQQVTVSNHEISLVEAGFDDCFGPSSRATLTGIFDSGPIDVSAATRPTHLGRDANHHFKD
jgi:hypothetical protein